MGRHGARCLVALALAQMVGAGVAHAAGPGASAAANASAPSDAELAAARRLFAEAVQDELHHRYPAALEKFQRVQSVKDTQPVRYRIATCLEAVGRIASARAMYEATATATEAATPEVTQAARERAEALARRVARVKLTLSPHAPADADVRIDGTPVTGPAGASVAVDPGTHHVSGAAPGAPPFETDVTLPEGGEAAIVVVLEPAAAVSAHAAPPPTAPPTTAPPAATRAASGRRTAGIAVVAGGAVLIGASVVVLVLRHQDIQSIDDACPGGVCPESQRDEVTRTRDRALAEGPLAIGLGAAGVVAAGIGTYLIATSHASSPTAARGFVAPLVARGGGGLVLGRSF